MKNPKFFLTTLFAAAAMAVNAADTTITFSAQNNPAKATQNWTVNNVNGYYVNAALSSTEDVSSFTWGGIGGASQIMNQNQNPLSNWNCVIPYNSNTYSLSFTITAAKDVQISTVGLQFVGAFNGGSLTNAGNASADSTIGFAAGNLSQTINKTLYGTATNILNDPSNERMKNNYTSFGYDSLFLSAGDSVTFTLNVNQGTSGLRTGLQNITISGESFYGWSGTADNNVWDTTSKNWSSGNVSYVNGYNAVFGNSADVSKTVNVVEAINAKTLTVQDAYTFSVAENASLTATGMNVTGGSVTFSGPGTTSIETVNVKSGSLIVSGGTLELTKSLTLAETIQVTAGALKLADGLVVTLADDFSVTSAYTDLDGTTSGSGNGFLAVEAAVYSIGEGATLEGTLEKVTYQGNEVTLTNGAFSLDTDYSTYLINTGTVDYTALATYYASGSENAAKLTGVSIASGATLNLNADFDVASTPIQVTNNGTVDIAEGVTLKIGTITEVADLSGYVGKGTIELSSQDKAFSLDDNFTGTVKIVWADNGGNQVNLGNVDFGGAGKVIIDGLYTWSGATRVFDQDFEIVGAYVGYETSTTPMRNALRGGSANFTFNKAFVLTDGASYGIEQGSMTFAGGVTFGEGSALYISGGSINGEVNVTAGGTLNLNGGSISANVTLDGGTINIGASDAFNYDAANQTITIKQGELAIGTKRLSFGDGNHLVLEGGKISGEGDGNGALDFFESNTVSATGDAEISATVRLRNSGQSVNFNVADGKTLTISGLLKENGNFVKSGTGTVVLSHANTYAGTTTIQEGTLKLSGEGSLGNGAVTIEKGGELQITADASVVFNAGLNINTQQGITNEGTVTFGESATINVAGLTDSWVSGTYNLITNTGTLNVGDLTIDDVSGYIAGRGGSAALDTSDGLKLVITAGQAATITWAGTESASTWNTVSDNQNWLLDGAPTYFVAGDNVIFDNTAANKTVTVPDNAVLILGNASVNSGAYTWKTGSGTATISGTDLVIADGASLQVGDGDGRTVALDFDSITLTGDLTYRNGDSTWKKAILNGGNIHLYDCKTTGLTIADAVLQADSTVTSHWGAFMSLQKMSGDKNLTLTGPDTGEGFKLTIGDLTAYTGTLSLVNGTGSSITATLADPSKFGTTAKLSVGAGTTLALTQSGTLALTNISGDGSLDLSGSANITLTSTTREVSTNLGIALSNTSSLTFAKGSGLASTVYTLPQIRTTTRDNFERYVTIDEGVTVRANTFNNGWGMGALTVNGTFELNEKLEFGTAGNSADRNRILGSGTIKTKQLRFVNVGTYTVDGGIRVEIGSGGIDIANSNTRNLGHATFAATESWSAVTGGFNLINAESGTTFEMREGTSAELRGVLAGAGKLIKSGTGILTLSGDNTYTGGTIINAGTLVAGDASSLGSGSVVLADGAKLDVSGIAGTMTIADLTIGKGSILAVSGTTDAAQLNVSKFTGWNTDVVFDMSFDPTTSREGIIVLSSAGIDAAGLGADNVLLGGAGVATDRGAAAEFVVEGDVLKLNYTAGVVLDDMVWDAGASGSWTAGGDTLWESDSFDNGVKFQNGDSVTFETPDAEIVLGSSVTVGGIIVNENASFSVEDGDAFSVTLSEGASITVAEGATAEFEAGITLTPTSSSDGVGTLEKKGAGKLSMNTGAGIWYATPLNILEGTVALNVTTDQLLYTTVSGNGTLEKTGAAKLNVGTLDSFAQITAKLLVTEGSVAIEELAEGQSYTLTNKVELGESGSIVVNAPMVNGRSEHTVDLTSISGSGTIEYAARGNTEDSGGESTSFGWLRLSDKFTGTLSVTNGLVDLLAGADDASAFDASRLGGTTKIDLVTGGLLFRNATGTVLTQEISVSGDRGVIRLYGNGEATITGKVTGTNLTHTDGGALTFSNTVELDEFRAVGGTNTFRSDTTFGRLTVNSGTTNLAGTTTIEHFDHTDGTVNIAGTVKTTQYVGQANDYSWNSGPVNIGSSGVLEITGDSNSTAAKEGSFQIAHWGYADWFVPSINIEGVLNVENAGISNKDGMGDIRVKSGGEFNMNVGLSVYDAGDNEGVIRVYLEEGGRLNVGAEGITNSKVLALNLNGGTIGSLAESWSSSRDLTLAGDVTIDTTKMNYTSGGKAVESTSGTTVTLSGGISGAKKLTKQGSGTLVLSGNNTYSGGTAIKSGTVKLGSSTALGTGVITLAGGNLARQDGVTDTITLAQAAVAVEQVATVENIAFAGGSWTFTRDLQLGLITDNFVAVKLTGAAFSVAENGGAEEVQLLAEGEDATGKVAIDVSGIDFYKGKESIVLFSGYTGTDTSVFTVESGTLSLDGTNVVYTASGDSLVLAWDPKSATSDGLWTASTFNGEAYEATTDRSFLFLPNKVDGQADTVKVQGGANVMEASSLYNVSNLKFYGDYRLVGERQSDTIAPSVTLAGGEDSVTGIVYVDDGKTVAFDKTIGVSGLMGTPGNLIKQGNGTLTLAADAEVFELGTVTIEEGTFGLSSETVDEAPVFGGVLSGSGTFMKTGSGVLELSGTNTHTGGTVVAEGILKLTNKNALPNGVIINTGATLELAADMDGTAYAYTLAGGTLKATTATGAGQAQIATGEAITLTADSAIDATASFGMVSSGYNANTLNLNGHTLTKAGSADLYLTNTTITAGTLKIAEGYIASSSEANTDNNIDASAADVVFAVGSGSAGGILVGGNTTDFSVKSIATSADHQGGATIEVNAGKTFTVAGTATGTDSYTYAGTIALAATEASGDTPASLASFIKRGNETLILNGIVSGGGKLNVSGGILELTTENTYTGGTEINGGTLKVKHIKALSSGAVTVNTGGTLELAGSMDGATNARYTLAGGTLKATAGTTYGQAQVAAGEAITLTANSAIDAAANFGMVSSGYGANTLNLNGHTLTKTGSADFYLCNTTVSAGTLKIAEGNFAWTSGANIDASAADVVFAVEEGKTGGITVGGTGSDFKVKSIATADTNAGTATIDIAADKTFTVVGTADGTGSYTYAGTISGGGSFVKQGNESLTLSGTISGSKIVVKEGNLFVGDASHSSEFTLEGGKLSGLTLGGDNGSTTATVAGGTAENWTLDKADAVIDVAATTQVALAGTIDLLAGKVVLENSLVAEDGSALAYFAGTATVNIGQDVIFDFEDLDLDQDDENANLYRASVSVFDLESGITLTGWDTITHSNIQIHGADLDAHYEVEIGDAGNLTIILEAQTLVWQSANDVWDLNTSNWLLEQDGEVSAETIVFADFDTAKFTESDEVTLGAGLAIKPTAIIIEDNVAVTLKAAGDTQILLGETALGSGASLTLVQEEGKLITFKNKVVGTATETFTLQNAVDVSFSETLDDNSLLSGDLKFVKTGAGTLAADVEQIEFTGTTSVNEGKIVVSATNALGTGTVTLNGGALELAAATDASVTVNNVIAGATAEGAPLVISGEGSVELTAENSYTGNTSVTGTAIAKNVAAFGASAVAIDGGRVELDSDNGIFATAFSGTGTLALASETTATLTASLSGLTGTLDVSNATLKTALAADSTFSGTFASTEASTIVVTQATTFAAGNADTEQSYAGALSLESAARFEKRGENALTLSGALDASAADSTIAVTGGSLKIGNDATAQSYAGTLSIDGGILEKVGANTLTLSGALTGTGNTTISAGTLELATASDATLTSVISGEGMLKKSGAGALTLAAGTNVNTVEFAAGTLANVKLGTDGVTALTVSATGTTLKDLTQDAGTLDVSAAAQTTLDTVTLSGGTVILGEMESLEKDAALAGKFAVAGSTTVGSDVVFNIASLDYSTVTNPNTTDELATVTLNIFDVANGTLEGWNADTLGKANFTIGADGAALSDRSQLKFDNGNVEISNTIYNLVWEGGDGVWASGNGDAWTHASNPADTVYMNSDKVTFAADATVTLGSQIAPTSMTLEADSDLVIAKSESYKITGSGTVSLGENASLTLNSAHSYTGATTLANGAALQLNLAAGDSAQFASSVAVEEGALSYFALNTGALDAETALETVVTGDLATSRLVVQKLGAGTLSVTDKLSGFTAEGRVEVKAGTLKAYGAPALGAALLSVDEGATLEVVAETDSSFENKLLGKGLFEKSGVGTLTVEKSNTFSGDVLVSAGTLKLTNADALGDAREGSTFTVAEAATLDLDFSDSFAKDFAGTGTIRANAADTLTLGGAGAGFTGTFEVNGGTISAQTATALGNGVIKLADASKQVVFEVVEDDSFAGSFVGAGTIEVDTGSLSKTLSWTGTASSEFSGTVNVADASSLAAGNAGVLGNASAVTLLGVDSELRLGTETDSVLEAKLSGAGDLVKVGTGTVTLANTGNDFSGDIYVEAGTLRADSVLAFGNAEKIELAEATRLDIRLGKGDSFTFNKGVRGYGDVAISGDGALVWTQQKVFHGNLDVIGASLTTTQLFEEDANAIRLSEGARWHAEQGFSLAGNAAIMLSAGASSAYTTNSTTTVPAGTQLRSGGFLASANKAGTVTLSEMAVIPGIGDAATLLTFAVEAPTDAKTPRIVLTKDASLTLDNVAVEVLLGESFVDASNLTDISFIRLDGADARVNGEFTSQTVFFSDGTEMEYLYDVRTGNLTLEPIADEMNLAYAAMVAMPTETFNQDVRSLHRRMDQRRFDTLVNKDQWEFFAQAQSMQVDNGDDRADSATFDFSTYGALVGGDVRLSDSTLFGLALAYDRGTADIHDSQGEIAMDNYRVTAYMGTVIGDSYFAEGGIHFGFASYEIEREGDYGVNDGETDGWSAGAFFATGGLLPTAVDDLFLKPYIGLAYLHTAVEKFDEVGTQSTTVEDMEADSLRARIGLGASYAFSFGETPTRFGMDVAFSHEFLDDELDADVSAAGMSYSRTLTEKTVAENAISVGASLDFSLSENTGLYMSYSADFGMNSDIAHHADIGFRFTY